MSNPTPNKDELEKILVNVCGGVRDDDKYAQDRIVRAEAAIRKYALAEALRIIPEDEDANYSPVSGVGGFDIEKVARNQLKAQLRTAFSKLWSSDG